MTLLLRTPDDLHDVPDDLPWIATDGVAPRDGRSRRIEAPARLLHEAFDQVRETWWRLGREMSAQGTGWLSHAATCASMNSDLGMMLAWDRIARDLAARTAASLMFCPDPWLFRHLAGLPGVAAGRPPALLPRQMARRARGAADRARLALRLSAAAHGLRAHRGKADAAARATLLVYGHPASVGTSRDAYFGSLMDELPGLARALHTDCPAARATALAADGATFSLHGFGDTLLALGGLFTRWRPQDAHCAGEYGWLIRRAAEIEGAGASAAATRWQTRCQERWLDARRPAVVAWPWENHPWERALVRAARKRDIATVGYQHTVIGRHMFNQSPASNPEGPDGLPDVIVCNGPAYRAQLERWGVTAARLAVGGAFRVTAAAANIHDPAGAVFVALAADARIAAQMMAAVQAAARPGRRFLVKDHPMYPFAFAESETIRRTRTLLAEQESLSAVIYSTGTVGLESLLSGLPTLRFLPEGLIATDILPDGIVAPTADAASLDTALDELTCCPEIARESVIAPVDLTVWRRYLLAA